MIKVQIKQTPLKVFFESNKWDSLETHKDEQIEFFHKKEAEWLIANITKRGAKVLDIGCGDGNSIAPISHSDIQIWGIDFSQRQIELAKQRFKDLNNISLIQQDAFTMNPEWKHQFDFVTCMGAGFGNQEDEPGLLRSMLWATKPGGKVVVTVYSKEARGAQRNWYIRNGMPIIEDSPERTVIANNVFSERFTPDKLKNLARLARCKLKLIQLTPIAYLAVYQKV